jgi:D-arginine dehydrogenase
METADIIVVGAGIAGASAAAALAPHARVLVLEAEAHPATHSTGRSAAIFVRNYGNHVIRALNDASFGSLTEYLSPRGIMTIASASEEEAFETFMADTTAEMISTKEACALFPLLRSDAAQFAAIERNASDIDVDRLMQDHLRALRHTGCEVVTHARLMGLTRVGDVWHAKWPGGEASAPIVINAAGAWADPVAALAGLSAIGVQPFRRSAAILPIEMRVTDWPMVLPATETWYAKPEAGQLMVSPADEDPVEPMDAWADDMILAEGLDRFAQAMQFEVKRVSHSWAGLRCFAPDRTPVVGFDPRVDGFFWLAGQGGYGVQTSPALAGLARDLIFGGDTSLPSEIKAAVSPMRYSS